MTPERRAALMGMGMVAALLAAGVSTQRYLRSPPKRRSFDAIHAMIPMRDGVALETVIFVPRGSHAPLPFLLRRTPYGLVPDDEFEDDPDSLLAELKEDGYIWVIQSLRGRFGSEGSFSVWSAPRDRSDPKSTDESTDAYDTIDWLVRSVPNNNGRVGTRGGSYDGWTTVMSLVDPHPALRCADEQASWDDQFVNDDAHHNGALRLAPAFEYAAFMEKQKDKLEPFEPEVADSYDFYLKLGALPHVDERYFHGKYASWEETVAHPDRDVFWQTRATASILKSTTVPNLNVAGFWDQEDFVGPLNIYARAEPNDRAHLNYLVVGPWNHGGNWDKTGRKLGPIDFGSDTARHFRQNIQRQWFAHWLHDAPLDLPDATIFESGSNRWRNFEQWPPTSGVVQRSLYLREGHELSFDAPPADAASPATSDSYVSDPANPVPFLPRPIVSIFGAGHDRWSHWLVQDQRFVDHRPDVLSYETEVLDQDLVVEGDIVAELYAATTGTDGDFVVKLIDVLPETEKDADLRGYQLIIADEILRGRYRDGFATSVPIPANQTVKYAIDLHPNAHAFLRGHRIMVQIQSTLFPLYDRNPQTFVPSIYAAKDSDFRAATVTLSRRPGAASRLVLPTLPE